MESVRYEVVLGGPILFRRRSRGLRSGWGNEPPKGDLFLSANRAARARGGAQSRRSVRRRTRRRTRRPLRRDRARLASAPARPAGAHVDSALSARPAQQLANQASCTSVPA